MCIMLFYCTLRIYFTLPGPWVFLEYDFWIIFGVLCIQTISFKKIILINEVEGDYEVSS